MTAKTRLYRKDWRVYRAAAVGGVVLLGLPYAAAAGEMLWDHKGGAWRFARTLTEAAFMGLALLVVTAAVFGGAAFAAERRDRSAEFLAALPVSRARAARSKLRAALTFLVAAWGVHFVSIVAAVVFSSDYRHWSHAVQFFDILCNTTCVAVMAFGVAWLMSSFVSSPAIAATFALALTTVTLALAIDLSWPDDERYNLMNAMDFIEASGLVTSAQVGPISVQAIGRLVMLVMGCLAWCAGTAVYVRRVTP